MLKGKRALSLQTVGTGEIYIGVDIRLDGGDASIVDGYGGRPVLNPWRGRSSEKQNGFGPGGPTPAGNWGTGASFKDEKTFLLGYSLSTMRSERMGAKPSTVLKVEALRG